MESRTITSRRQTVFLWPSSRWGYIRIQVLKSNHRHRYLTIGDGADFHRRMDCTEERQDRIIKGYLRTKLSMIGSEFRARGFISVRAKDLVDKRPGINVKFHEPGFRYF